jgi:nitrite reductase (NO-forming)
MRFRSIVNVMFVLVAIAATACATLVAPGAAHESVSVQQAAPTPDYSDVTPPPYPRHQTTDPVLQPAPGNPVKEITLHVRDVTTDIAPDVPVDLWTFEGTAPGPALHVNLGDTVKFTLINDGQIEHSIDFHAAQTPWNVNYQSIKPGEQLSFDWKANYPGVFMYHCGTPPVIHHIGNGMYGAIVVSAPDLKPVAREYVLVQSEFYVTQGKDGVFHSDGAKMNAVTPDYVVFNGYANQYRDAPLTANPGERIRLWVLNAGPTTFSAFHVIGALFDTADADGNPKNEQHGMQTVTIPPGGGYMVELVIPDAGLYPFVTHSFAYTGKGALGLIKVGDGGASQGGNTNTTGMAH